MTYLLLAIVGLGAGVLGGMLGIGGSVIMLPAMKWILDPPGGAPENIHQYQAAAMMVNFLLCLPSAWAHLKNHAVWPKVWSYVAASAFLAIVGGVLVSNLFDKDAARYLNWLVGVFFLYVLVQNLYRAFRPPKQEGLSRQEVEAFSPLRKCSVGVPMGFAAGLLGIGGGAVAVPLQQMVLKMPMRNAIATSAAVIASVSWLGALTKNLTLGAKGSIATSCLLVACLAPTAMVGAYVGGHLTHRLPLRLVRVLFAVLMAVSAATMFLK
jgi:hypothetical protein